MNTPARILFSVLNWGLGHASRSIPLIRYLVAKGVVVQLASDGNALALLRQEFPDLPTHSLPAYNIHYQHKNMHRNMGLQLPKIAATIQAEHRTIQKLVATEKIDALISDNRFGCYHPAIPSVFITHQIHIQTGAAWTNYIAKAINHFYIKKYDTCWIPDVAGTPNLAGKLAHDHTLDKVQYLGCLSRMRRYARPRQYDVIVVLSGPEPQRKYLEERATSQLLASPYKALIVQGIALKHTEQQLTPKVKKVSFLTSEALNDAIMASQWVVCRSGYSSVMDLVALQQPAILIPTPGQTEQEYLVRHLKNNLLFVGQTQEQLDIQQGIKILQNRTHKKSPLLEQDRYKKVLDMFVENLQRS